MVLKRLQVFLSLSAAALLALAATPADAQTVGAIISNTRSSFANIPMLLSVVSVMLGLMLAITSIFKFKDHVDNPNQNPLSVPVKRFLAAGMMLSGPYMLAVLSGTLFRGNKGALVGGGRHGNPGGRGLDQMVYRFISDFAGPMEKLLIAFTYIAAISLLIVGINRLTKTAQEGPRGPTGLGTMMTFLAAGALFSFGGMMGSFTSTLFGKATVSTYAQVSSSIVGGSEVARIASVIEAVLAFVMIVGYIAFIRGWFVLKAFGDGSGNATLAQALTFLFGGTLAINLGSLVNALQATLGVSGVTFQ